MKIKMTFLTLLFISMTFSAASAEEPLVDQLSLPDEYMKDLLAVGEDSPVLPEKTIHTVIEGDNLHDIAAANNISVELLMELNGLTDHVIYPKDQLRFSSDTEIVKHPDSIPPEGPGKEMTVEATAYTAYCYGCIGITAYGIDLRSNPEEKVIAVDPTVIPLGTKVWVEGYGEAIAGDTGGAIKGNRIDVFIPTYDGAIEWGRQEITLKILE
ncbi:3D (Asp-Asp-Asp) domain-containing protein [Psychrobacillus sp. OK028]|uniref:3D domain-containing protein n=1 Tax=Psychrobacillus sp. OK028 TaxID=1884359 RepID=UPI00088957C0|nr:3D domain-containing protein [Psychrobacillus sp. OK028]SDN74878.1 3D (Asp-Asp-Asp) domain-containing protein [Psychrobacillus sp. OK028]